MLAVDLTAIVAATCNDSDAILDAVLSDYAGLDGIIGAVLSVAAPLIEAAVCEQIAQKLLADSARLGGNAIQIERAVRIARGES